MKEDNIDLDDYHKQWSAQLAKEISGQSLMSSEAFTKQVKRVASKSNANRTNPIL